jgi:erythromycin esterase
MSDVCLDRILPLLGENGVLGLDEPTHGSANAFAWKLGVIQELARRGLLAAFALEESMIAGRQLEAALHGRGDLDEALATGSSVWRTETIRDGLRQLAAILAERRSASGDAPSTERLAAPADLRTAPTQRPSASVCDPPAPSPRILGIDVRAPQRTARALLDLGHDEPLLHAVADNAELDPHEVEALEQLCARLERSPEGDCAALARNLGRHVDAYLLDPDLGRLHRRDTHMAHTLLEQLPARGITVVWAHNEHIARNPDFFGGPSMGAVLHEALGPRYVPVGVMCGEGEARAVDHSTGEDGYRAVALPPLRPGTTDAALHALGPPFVTRAEFDHPGPRRFLGWRIDTSLFDDPEAVRTSFETERPSSDFEALVLLPDSVADVAAELSVAR